MKWELKTLDDDFEIKGHWWLPGQEANELPGILTYKSRKGNLFLFGTITSFAEAGKTERLKPKQPYEIMLGRATDGTRVTLYRVFPGVYQPVIGGPGGPGDEEFNARFVFVGAHYQTPKEIHFKHMSFSATHLESWVGYFPIHPFDGFDEKDSKKISLQGRVMDDIDLPIPSIGATLQIEASVLQSYRPLESITLKQLIKLNLMPETVQSFDWFSKQMYYVLNLMTLLMGHPAYIRNIKLSSEERDTDYGTKTSDEVYVFYNPSRHHEKELPSISSHDMLIPLGCLRGRLEGIVTKWFANVGTFDDVWALFFSTVYNRSFSVEYRFQKLANCLECYSRLRLLPPASPDPKRTRIYLRERIKAVINSLQPDSVSLFSSNTDVFCEKFVKLRDYQSHYAVEMKADDLIGTEKFVFCERLQVLILFLLLKEIGFTEAEIQAVITNNQRLAQIRYYHFKSDM